MSNHVTYRKIQEVTYKNTAPRNKNNASKKKIKNKVTAEVLNRKNMTDGMEQDAVDTFISGCIQFGSKDFSSRQKIAEMLKEKFERIYSGGWCCVVGNFGGSFLTSRNIQITYDDTSAYLYQPSIYR